MKSKIPSQEIGAESKASSTIVHDNLDSAKNHFEIVKKRFLDINSWELFAGDSKAEFSLRNQNGKLSLDHPKVGDFISIKIPLLPNKNNDHFDWVKIEVCEEESKNDYEAMYIRVRPTSDPTHETDEISHFLDSTATSNFFIKRNGLEISAEVVARNEIPNLNDKSVLGKVRNTVVAVGGMLVGSKIQWDGLTSGLIKNEK